MILAVSDQRNTDHYDSEWTWESSDGPISIWLEYSILTDDDTGRSIGHGLDIFRKSRQFCLDARQKSEAHMGRQQHQAFDEVARRRLPPELRNQILGYIEYRDPFPYLEKLDIAEAYAPFPTICGEARISVDFPAVVIVVSFAVVVGARGNDGFVSLDQVGFGPISPIRVDPVEDWIRHDAPFRGNGIYRDSREDALMIGGLGGLKDAMIHGRTLMNGWEGDVGLSYNGEEEGVLSESTSWWHYGRNLSSEKVAKEVMRGLHSETDCEWCVNVTDEFDLTM
ncbi:hypothetical protein FPHYL_12573 [Fusarium phyllophilum]|uniref:Uncharacterized protein n=1 Tax=Fusarium phyllophilum TaxID=47803 RepID=A0A8H5ILN2_9HYPO|nr:hypothetical protein FPHYL_12573 [Fusarium phyllophilum]